MYVLGQKVCKFGISTVVFAHPIIDHHCTFLKFERAVKVISCFPIGTTARAFIIFEVPFPGHLARAQLLALLLEKCVPVLHSKTTSLRPSLISIKRAPKISWQYININSSKVMPTYYGRPCTNNSAGHNITT